MLVMCFCIMICGMTSNATSADKTEETNSQAVIKAPFLEISDIYFNKKTVTKNESLQYRFTLSFVDTFDYSSEEFSDGPFRYDMYEVRLYWKSSKRQRIAKVYKWPGDRNSITIEDTIPIKDGIQAGEWILSNLYVCRYNSTEDDEDALAICHTENGNKGGHSWIETDLSSLSFNVTGVKKKADEKAPTIVKNSMSLSKTKIKKKKKSTFSVKIKDANEIKEVACIWEEQTKRSPDETYDEYLTMKYNPKTKKYQCKYVMRSEVIKAQLRCIIAEDIYGNIKYYRLSDKNFKKKYGKNFSQMVIYRKK